MGREKREMERKKEGNFNSKKEDVRIALDSKKRIKRLRLRLSGLNCKIPLKFGYFL